MHSLPSAPSATQQLWLSPILGAPEISVPSMVDDTLESGYLVNTGQSVKLMTFLE